MAHLLPAAVHHHHLLNRRQLKIRLATVSNSLRNQKVVTATAIAQLRRQRIVRVGRKRPLRRAERKSVVMTIKKNGTEDKGCSL